MMMRLNEVVISSCINKLYGIKIDELIYDSDIDNKVVWMNTATDDTTCDTSCDSCDVVDYSDYSSEDEYYVNVFRKKHGLENQCFGKRNILLITIDDRNNAYGCYFPDRIDSYENYCTDMSLFTITRGIEIVECKYAFDGIMNCISFPKDCLYCIGEESRWLYKITNRMGLEIEWNDNQKMITTYDRAVMRSSKLRRVIVYACVHRENVLKLVSHVPSVTDSEQYKQATLPIFDCL